ncbi:hypothetical protein [Synechococcus sp. MW101C3]|uniref:hypothetical protein n=1 Tax=Synechococcus sp. MW101C3 TaxID=210768 RepID=UPI001181A0E9|nr:hypothetical protein [Synechococcus sp. MW101C3]
MNIDQIAEMNQLIEKLQAKEIDFDYCTQRATEVFAAVHDASDKKSSADVKYWYNMLLQNGAEREPPPSPHTAFLDFLEYVKAHSPDTVVVDCVDFSKSIRWHLDPSDKASAGFLSKGCYRLFTDMVSIEAGFHELFLKESPGSSDWRQLLASCHREVSANTLEESVAESSAQEHISQNLQKLRNNITHWHVIVAKGGLRVPFSNGNTLSFVPPAGTIVISERLGSLLGYPFIIGSLVVCPVYSGWINTLESVYLIDLEGMNSYFLGKDMGSRYLFKEHYRTKLDAGISTLMKDVIALSRDGTQPVKLAYIAGQRINFGHTIIQDMNFIESASSLDPYNKASLLIGEHDYLCTSRQLSASDKWKPENVLPIREFACGYNTFAIPAFECYPLPTFRATSSSIDKLSKYFQASPGLPITKKSAIYLSIDQRTGARSCNNYDRICDCIVELALRHGTDAIILDSLTSVPVYGKNGFNRIVEHGLIKPFEPEIYKQIKMRLESCSLMAQDWHGSDLLSKVVYAQNFQVKAAVASYGSSLMIPIYILNCPVYIFGHELHDKALGEWRWHTGVYCFDQRIEPEHWITSTGDHNGYCVDIPCLGDALEDALSATTNG